VSSASEPLSILLLARSLELGGAERQLCELAIGLHKRGHVVRVAVFYGGGVLEPRLQRAGIEILHLGKRGRWDALGFLRRTRAVVRRIDPDILYSFSASNVVSALVTPAGGRTRLVWSVRNSNFDMSIDHWLARLVFRAEGLLARRPKAIVANSSAGRDFAGARGFPSDRIVVVPNGIDAERFRRDPALRTGQRAELGLADRDIAVGVLGRLNATKGYPDFLRAAALVAKSAADARFLCVGAGPEMPALQQLAQELGIADRVMFTGEMDPMAALNAFDICCSPSTTEGFSNSIAEAMACELPCIVTDVGDSAAIVGDCGIVVPPSSPAALAEAIERQIANRPGGGGAAARQRIVDNFSVDSMVERTLEVFRSVLPARAAVSRDPRTR
jgi:glycosyltransferase involved in cell wall biosynthesis